MKPRHALARLRSNTIDAGWGARYAITVRVPRDAFPQPYPVPSPELAAHLDGYGSTGDFGVGKQFGDGTGARLQPFDQRSLGSNVPGTYATAMVGTVAQYDDEWWDVTDAVEKNERDEGWEWLREYADNLAAQSQWIDENILHGNWRTAAMNDAWMMARSYCSARYWSRDTVGGVDSWNVTFAVKTYYVDSVPALARAVARFVRAARHAGVNARYF